MCEENLKNRTIKGFGWNFLDNVLNRGISFVVGIVLARLISPSEYGLIGIVLIFIAVFNSIVESVLGTALIRKNDCTEDDYNTVFHTNLILSVILFFVFYVSAHSRFFQRAAAESFGKSDGLCAHHQCSFDNTEYHRAEKVGF